jgi:hypothetical protein
MPKKMLILLVLLVTVLATAPLAMAQPLLRPPSVEDRLTELAAQIPGFGGLYYQDGKPNVWLVGNSGRGAVQQRFGADVRIHPARYAFTELQQWRDRLRGVLGLAGVVLLDLDEARNRLVIGVERGAATRDRHAVGRHVAAQRVPNEAVIVEETDPVQRLQTLRDPFYPVPGGVQITLSNGGICTLGFNAFSHYGFGFVTNSHCTNIRGGVEGTAYYQPDFSGNYIGQEVADPFYFSCAGGRACRYSDSAFALYNSFDLGEFPAIAKPDFAGQCGGSINVDPFLPRFIIRSRQQFPYVGEILDKVGRTTGWTYGNVSATCVDTNVALSNVTMLCQDFVEAASQPGDSGSPVFRWNGYDDVTLYGVLWGSSGSCRLVFSALANIEYELGPLTVH